MFCPAIFRIEINLNSQWMFSIGLPFLDDGDGCDDDDDEMTNQLWFRSASMPQAIVRTVSAVLHGRLGAPSQWHVFPFAVVTLFK